MVLFGLSARMIAPPTDVDYRPCYSPWFYVIKLRINPTFLQIITVLSSVGGLKDLPDPYDAYEWKTKNSIRRSETEILTCLKNLGKLKLGIREYLKHGYARKSPRNPEAWKV